MEYKEMEKVIIEELKNLKMPKKVHEDFIKLFFFMLNRINIKNSKKDKIKTDGKKNKST